MEKMKKEEIRELAKKNIEDLFNVSIIVKSTNNQIR